MDFMQLMLNTLRSWYDRMRRIMSFLRESFLPSDSTEEAVDGFLGF